MEILMVAAEFAPYVRESEAADTVAALAKSLKQLGHSVTVALPRYSGFESKGLLVARRLTPYMVGSTEVMVFDGQVPSGVNVVLLDAPGYFDGPAGRRATQAEEARRFLMFSRAVAEYVRQRKEQKAAFEIIHLHDWMAAMVPLCLQQLGGGLDIPFLLTIHDATHQGNFAQSDLRGLGIEGEASPLLEGRVNFLKSGLLLVNAVNTVSERYAEELKSPAVASALSSVFAALDKPVVGITNGVDYALVNPATDTALESRFDAEDSANKGRAKASVLRQLELELELDRPLVVSVGGLETAESAEALAAAIPQILRHDLALIVAGRADEKYAPRFAEVSEEFASDYVWVVSPDEGFLRKLYAAADIALIVAQHEPCGNRQFFAQRYGAVPVASARGGLINTIVDVDAALETGTGFLFDELTAKGVTGGLERALAAYASPQWASLRRRVMRLDVSWDRPARRYLQLYRRISTGQ